MPGLDSPFCIGSEIWPGLAKTSEECGELQQVLGKLIATAGERIHFDGSDLVERVQEEVADVRAALDFLVAVNGLDTNAIDRRVAMKVDRFWRWHTETLREVGRGGSPVAST